MGGVLWSSWARAGLANSHQKRGGLVNFLGILPKEHEGEGPGRWGDYHKGPWGSHVRDLHLLVTLWAVIRGLLGG